MYISKWWGNMIGGSDDSLCLVDYFEYRAFSLVPLSTVLHELMLDQYLGKTTLQESKEMFFVITYPDGRSMEVDFDISIDPVIDLCALLVEQIHSGSICTLDLVPSSKEPVTFKIALEKQPLKMLLDELTLFCREPLSYDLAEMVPEDHMMELAEMCQGIADELNAYYQTI